MGGEEEFMALIQRIQAGDEQAAEELVRVYEPQIRRAVRVRLTDPALRKMVDSVDICQSVLANFFVRMASGQFEIHSPGELISLLVTMARNKLHDWSRKQQAECRDRKREVSIETISPNHLAVQDETPSQKLEGKEILQRVDEQLTDLERRLVHLRAQGLSWADIAEQEGTSPDALRMRMQRALDRVTAILGIDN